ncbi:MAG: hypothetical protein O2780_00045 [Proteobacteria bacterium]|nr:hypothetical protein [Pseudomonadota bacterium]MDA1299456.1 hypothetical protein [Pseudomonadota bacterium]
MRGRAYAIGASVVTAPLPLVNWISTAIVSLVILRKGGGEGGLVLLWTLLPLGGLVYLSGDPTPLIAILGTASLALILRVTVSWEFTLAAAVLIGGVGSLVFQYTATDLLVTFVEIYLEYSKSMAVSVSEEVARNAIVGFFAMGQAYAMLALLVLARWWQSMLYNPGGFQKEFHGLRMTPRLSTVIVLLLVLCIAFNDLLGRWIPLLTVPLIFSGLGIVHWMIKSKEMSSNWLVAFYLLLLFFFQFVYPLLASLALMDSYLDLRKRMDAT